MLNMQTFKRWLEQFRWIIANFLEVFRSISIVITTCVPLLSAYMTTLQRHVGKLQLILNYGFHTDPSLYSLLRIYRRQNFAGSKLLRRTRTRGRPFSALNSFNRCLTRVSSSVLQNAWSLFLHLTRKHVFPPSAVLLFNWHKWMLPVIFLVLRWMWHSATRFTRDVKLDLKSRFELFVIPDDTLFNRRLQGETPTMVRITRED